MKLYNKWRMWFAWYPVYVSDLDRYVWGKKIWRKITSMSAPYVPPYDIHEYKPLLTVGF